MIVERLRNVPRPQQGLGLAEPVDMQRQAGDAGYRKAVAPPPVPDDLDVNFGLKPATFGLRPRSD